MSASGMPTCRIAGFARRPAAAATGPAGTCWTPGINRPAITLRRRGGAPPERCPDPRTPAGSRAGRRTLTLCGPPWVGQEPLPALRVDEVHLRGVNHVRLRPWRVHPDLVRPPHGSQARIRPGQEAPRRDLGQLLLAGERRHIRHPQVVSVDVHGHEHHARRARAQITVGVEELLGHDGADVGAVRVYELQHHHPPPQASQRHRVAALISEGETRSARDRDRGQLHQVRQGRRDAGRDPGGPQPRRLMLPGTDHCVCGTRGQDHDRGSNRDDGQAGTAPQRQAAHRASRPSTP
jgi:hypothetical protein